MSLLTRSLLIGSACGLVLFTPGVRAATPDESAISGEMILDGVAAYVNDHVITIGEVIGTMQLPPSPAGQIPSAQERKDLLQEAYDHALEELVEHHLVLDYYAEQEGQIPEWVFEQRVQDIIRDSYGGDRGRLEVLLSKEHLTYAEWRENMRERLVVSSMRSAHVLQKVSVQASAVREYYERHREEFSQPGQVKIRVLHWDAGSQSQAESAAQELRNGEAFDVVATTNEDATTMDMGWMKIDELSKAFRQPVMSLKAGGTTAPINADDRVYVLYVESVKEGRPLAFSEAQAQIERELRHREAERLHAQWIELLRETSYVKVLPAGIDW